MSKRIKDNPGSLKFPLSKYAVSTGFNCGEEKSCGPYLLPVCLQQVKPYTLILEIPNVAGKDAAPGKCVISTGKDNPDFSMNWQKPPFGGVVAEVTVIPDHVFSSDPADRAVLKKSFALFRQALDQMEAQSSPQCLLPGGAGLIANRVAASLPLQLEELLYYYYGFDSEMRSIDLYPGMRLSIETGAYQFAAPSSSPGSESNAFVSAGQVKYLITRGENMTLSFNAYLDQMTPYNICPRGAPLAGVIDLAAQCSDVSPPSTYARRYFRLIYPNQFGNPTDTGSQPKITGNVTLLGADSLKELEMATQTYVDSKECAASADNSVVCLYFSGRVSVVPEIPVVFQGNTFYVPVGTTFKNMLDTLVDIPPDLAARLLDTSDIVFWRYSLNALCSSQQSGFGQSTLTFEETTHYIPVNGDKGNLATQLDVPLIRGDVLRIDTSGAQSQEYDASTRSLEDPGKETSAGPYLLPWGFKPGNTGDTLILMVPDVAGPAMKAGACEINVGEAGNNDFSLEWKSGGSGYTALVKVKSAGICSDDPAKRAGVRQSFAAFRRQLEKLEIENDCLIPGGAALVARQAAGSLPLRYDEILYYYYGIDLGSRTIDLQLGMRLVMESGAYQFVAPASMPGSVLNSYVSRSFVSYDVVRDTRQCLTFSPYIGGMKPYQVTGAGEEAANRIDLAQADNARRHYRLIYPASFAPADSSAVPQPPTAGNVTLLGADTLEDLDAAAAACLKGRPMPETQPSIVTRYFTGRSGLIPHICIGIQGNLEYVPIGTTLHHILDRYTVLAKDEVYSFTGRGSNRVLSRYSIPSLQEAPTRTFGSIPVQFEKTTPYVPVPGGSGTVTQWDIPLVTGDMITWLWST
jgi:hypothetical protein